MSGWEKLKIGQTQDLGSKFAICDILPPKRLKCGYYYLKWSVKTKKTIVFWFWCFTAFCLKRQKSWLEIFYFALFLILSQFVVKNSLSEHYATYNKNFTAQFKLTVMYDFDRKFLKISFWATGT